MKIDNKKIIVLIPKETFVTEGVTEGLTSTWNTGQVIDIQNICSMVLHTLKEPRLLRRNKRL